MKNNNLLNTLRIATRKSPLALWQAEFVKQSLQQFHPDLTIELIGITTTADKFIDRPLYEIGGKGLFVKELENALLEKQADIAVHSIKDLPAEFPAGLELAVICKRADPRDVLISERYQHFVDLPLGAIIGTSSLRRQAQLAFLRPDLQFKNLRGNVGSRLQKLHNGEFDAIVLAAAGLERLGLVNKITEYFSTQQLLPAIGQGAIGIECRSDDAVVKNIISVLDDLTTRYCIVAERNMNAQFGGNCNIPIAAHAILHNNLLEIHGLVGKIDGSKILRASKQGAAFQAEQLGKDLATDLFQQGAKTILP